MHDTEIIVSSHLINKLAEKIETETGLSFAGSKDRDLRSAVSKMTEAIECHHEVQCVEWLLSEPWNKEKSDLCVQHLTIGETYFFREPRALELVKDYARMKLSESGGAATRLRIWSAGCCTGEEPYSIAISLRQGAPELDFEHCTILATDINKRYLQTAQAALYRHWSFRSAEAHVQKSHFLKAGEKYQLNETIKRMVTFAELNLAEPVYPSVATNTGAMDIIFCRNVLMYFSKQQVRNVIERFRQCLVNGGWLIVSPSEASSELFTGFTGTYYPDAIYFQKSDGRKPLPDLIQGPSRDNLIARQGMFTFEASANANSPRLDTHAAKEEINVGSRSKVSGRPVKKTVLDQNSGPVFDANSSIAARFHAQALAAIESGDQAEALQNLRRALYLRPDSVIHHYLMGVVRSAQYKKQDAFRQFEITISLLASFKDDDIIPFSEGWSAAHLRESARSYLEKGA